MHKFFIRTNEQYIGPFSLEEVMRMNVPPGVMIADGTPDTWKKIQVIEFKEQLKDNLKEKIMINKPFPDRMIGYGFDVAHDHNLNDSEKGYSPHDQEEYCHSDCAYITIPKGKLSLIGNPDEVDKIFNDSDLSNIIDRITASGELQASEHESLEDSNLLMAKREELKKKLLNGTTQTTGILRDPDISEDVDSISIPRSLRDAGPVEADGNSNTLREAKEEEWMANREALKAKLLRGEKISLPQNTPSNGNGSINIPKGGLFSGGPTAEDLERIKATRARHIQHNHKDVPKEDVSIRLPGGIVFRESKQRCK